MVKMRLYVSLIVVLIIYACTAVGGEIIWKDPEQIKFANKPNERFDIEQAKTSFAKPALAVGDWDNDGDIDIILAKDFLIKAEFRLFRNVGDKENYKFNGTSDPYHPSKVPGERIIGPHFTVIG